MRGISLVLLVLLASLENSAAWHCLITEATYWITVLWRNWRECGLHTVQKQTDQPGVSQKIRIYWRPVRLPASCERIFWIKLLIFKCQQSEKFYQIRLCVNNGSVVWHCLYLRIMRWMVSFTPWLAYPLINGFECSYMYKLVWTQSLSGRCTKSHILSDIELGFLV